MNFTEAFQSAQEALKLSDASLAGKLKLTGGALWMLKSGWIGVDEPLAKRIANAFPGLGSADFWFELADLQICEKFASIEESA